MDQKTLIARLRQLEVADNNALAVYTELSGLIKDEIQQKLLKGIAEDEKRHINLCKEILYLLGV